MKVLLLLLLTFPLLAQTNIRVEGRGIGIRPLKSFSSSDLKKFTFERKILEGRSDHFDGHNYPFMQIDEDDLIFVLRHAHGNERGQPQRWHDANHLTFHRSKTFRQKK
ncbi:MAG: hypothetical protein QNL33_01370 [Akkermansiaceae bacterium]|jgi:hypothetical protein